MCQHLSSTKKTSIKNDQSFNYRSIKVDSSSFSVFVRYSRISNKYVYWFTNRSKQNSTNCIFCLTEHLLFFTQTLEKIRTLPIVDHKTYLTFPRQLSVCKVICQIDAWGCGYVEKFFDQSNELFSLLKNIWLSLWIVIKLDWDYYWSQVNVKPWSDASISTWFNSLFRSFFFVFNNFILINRHFSLSFISSSKYVHIHWSLNRKKSLDSIFVE